MPLTDDRIERIENLVNGMGAYGFRSECAELLREVKHLRRSNERMRFVAGDPLSFPSEPGPQAVAEVCVSRALECDSSLLAQAGNTIFDLMKELAEARDAAADAVERARRAEQQGRGTIDAVIGRSY
jgi:hypothetical protein